MAKFSLLNGQTSVILRVLIQSNVSAIEAGLTGLTFTSSGLTIATLASTEASAIAYTASATIETIPTIGTFSTPSTNKCRFKEIDPIYMPGIYEIQLSDARWAVTNAKSVIINVFGAANAVPVISEIQLDPYTIASQPIYYPTIYRNSTDMGNVFFEWTGSGGTITATRSINAGTYAGASGSVSYLRADGTSYIWQIAYAAADRPASGNVVFRLTDGSTTRYLPVEVISFSLAAIASAVHQASLENNWTHEEAMRVILSAVAAKASGTGATISYRDINDTKDRIVATAAGGERTAITYDKT